MALSLPNMTQAAAFLTAENKFWNHACRKGLKGGDFNPILKWYNLIASQQAHLASLISADPDSYKNIIQVISSGLSSQSYEVATKCCDTLSLVIQGQKGGAQDTDITKLLLSACLASINLHP